MNVPCLWVNNYACVCLAGYLSAHSRAPTGIPASCDSCLPDPQRGVALWERDVLARRHVTYYMRASVETLTSLSNLVNVRARLECTHSQRTQQRALTQNSPNAHLLNTRPTAHANALKYMNAQ